MARLLPVTSIESVILLDGFGEAGIRFSVHLVLAPIAYTGPKGLSYVDARFNRAAA
jgi:hypothetical protein